MTQNTNKPRVSTDEMRTQIREQLEAEQELDLIKRMLDEHREELHLVREMKPWFRAGRWFLGLIVSAAIGWVARGGPTTLKPKPVPCVQVQQKVPAKTVRNRPQR
jgi:hypothetical protein